MRVLARNKVLWRYDPIILNDKFDLAFHKEQFIRLCSKLGRCTRATYKYLTNLADDPDVIEPLRWLRQRSGSLSAFRLNHE